MSEQQDLKINTLENNYSNMAKEIGELKDTVKVGFKDVMYELKSFKKEADEKYALKYVEEEITKMKDKKDERNYSWLTYVISTGIGVLITVLGWVIYNVN